MGCVCVCVLRVRKLLLCVVLNLYAYVCRCFRKWSVSISEFECAFVVCMCVCVFVSVSHHCLPQQQNNFAGASRDLSQLASAEEVAGNKGTLLRKKTLASLALLSSLAAGDKTSQAGASLLCVCMCDVFESLLCLRVQVCCG